MTIKYNLINCPGPPHKMAYTEWGDSSNSKVLICVHGLTRTGRDFDFLASALFRYYRVICPDIVGRGESDWLDSGEGYTYPTYIKDILTLLEQLKINKVDWIGTSMGGLIGMFLATLPHSPIKRLILNDVGAFIPKEALRRIAKYVLFGVTVHSPPICRSPLFFRNGSMVRVFLSRTLPRMMIYVITPEVF